VWIVLFSGQDNRGDPSQRRSILSPHAYSGNAEYSLGYPYIQSRNAWRLILGTTLVGERCGTDQLVVYRTIIECLVLNDDFQNRRRMNLTLDQSLRQRILNILL